MPSYLITGAARGIGVCFINFFLIPNCFCVPVGPFQLEFVRQLSARSQNTVFALDRSKMTADRLLSIHTKNVHIFEADITDHVALKVLSQYTVRCWEVS
jgi:nucleoside-diphosphate-sugar epimerase